MMKSIIVVPSYWRKGELEEDDIIYDHPTDLINPEETISKTLESLKIVKGNFDILVIGAPTNPSIGNEMDEKIVSIIKLANLSAQVFYFGHKNFQSLQKSLKNVFPKFSSLVSNRGYSNIRNLCILIPHLLDYEIAIFIDDDELITDKNYVIKATEFIGKTINKTLLGLVVGFYKNLDGSIYVDESNIPWWELVWNKPKLMNEGFRIVEESITRLADTPFAFGGNMIIHKHVWLKIPFDPLIRRGEDMDYLRNVKMFEFGVKLDRKLFIEHRPPKSKTPYLTRLHEDIYRFLYAQAKTKYFGLKSVDYLPYPGSFFINTQGKVLLTELLYFIYYSQKDLIQIKSFEDLLDKLKELKPIYDKAIKFANENKNFYSNFQKQWKEMMKIVPKDISHNLVTKMS
ncbi:MAG: hypothetical protein HeimC3_42420 [Candidatus Heimdallarchaeota archaeon LC_3]|nr:MAG: hypothetical protein HeimC3_42420 [Candidatus Heimdallarchaeota archaeon LC_3]